MIEALSAFDTHVLEFFYALRDPSLVQAFIWISELGTVATVYGLAACTALVLIVYRLYAHAAGLAISVATSGIAILLIKGVVERVRPPLSFQAYSEIWYSFPSAHAALAVAFYGFLAAMVWKMMPSFLGKLLAVSAVVLIGSIAFSRLYLGVHYLSDVVAGLLLGALCAWLGLRWVMFAHKV